MRGRDGRRPGASLLLLALAALALPARADAHRLDEYLQAAKISVETGRVGVELELSPGVAVAGRIIGEIDADGDGRISNAEADAYATRVVHALILSVDGQPTALHVERRMFPAVEDMRQGVGTIRLEASARTAASSGHRGLTFTNGFMPGGSVYLVNALVSADPHVTLVSQRRDPLQRHYTLDYDVAGSRTWIGWSGAAAGLIGLLVIRRTRRPEGR